MSPETAAREIPAALVDLREQSPHCRIHFGDHVGDRFVNELVDLIREAADERKPQGMNVDIEGRHRALLELAHKVSQMHPARSCLFAYRDAMRANPGPGGELAFGPSMRVLLGSVTSKHDLDQVVEDLLVAAAEDRVHAATLGRRVENIEMAALRNQVRELQEQNSRIPVLEDELQRARATHAVQLRQVLREAPINGDGDSAPRKKTPNIQYREGAEGPRWRAYKRWSTAEPQWDGPWRESEEGALLDLETEAAKRGVELAA